MVLSNVLAIHATNVVAVAEARNAPRTLATAAAQLYNVSSGSSVAPRSRGVAIRIQASAVRPRQPAAV